MNKINYIIILFCLFYGGPASACYYYEGYSVATTLNIDMGAISIASNAVGGVIATKEGPMTNFGGAPAGFSCGAYNDSTPASANLGLSGDGTTTANATYSTNIPGIGVRIYYYTLQPYGSEPSSPQQIATVMPVTIQKPYTTMYRNTNAALKIELVKTGTVEQVQGGKLIFNRIKLMGVDNHSGYEEGALDLVDLNLTATITSNTCDVDATSPTRVELQPADANTLQHKGATTGDTPFEIRLKCTGQTDVNLLLDGQEDTDVTGQGVLAIKKTTESAKGIGLQLLYNDLPVELEKEFSTGMSAEGSFTIPLTARYYRTTEIPVKAGGVSATVVYSLTYK